MKTQGYINKSPDIIFIMFLIIAIILVFSLSVTWPILNGWDDSIYVLYNRYLGLSSSNILRWFSSSIGGLYMPLPMLSYMVDYSIWGLNSVGYHLQNIFWHIIAVIFIYKNFRLFEVKSWIAFFICLIFAFHPQRVESVVWIAERKDVLCCAFYFSGIYFYIKNYDKKPPIVSFVLFILAILSKPMAISLPAILIVFLFYKTKAYNPVYYIKKLYPFLAVMLFFIPLSLLTHENSVIMRSSFFTRIYNGFYNFLWYAKQTLFPYNLSPIYPRISFHDTVIFTIIAYAVLTLIVLMFFLKEKETFTYKILPVILCYLLSLLPVCGLVVVPGAMDRSDRFSYIPSVYLLFGIALICNYLSLFGKL